MAPLDGRLAAGKAHTHGVRDAEEDNPLLLGAGGDDEGSVNAGGAAAVRKAKSAHMQRASWVDTSVILLGLIMGSGTLGLPYAMAQLGWYVGIGACFLFGVAAIYSGLLLASVRNRFCPDAETYSEVAADVVSGRFGAFTQWAIWTNWAVLLPYYLVSVTKALQVAVGLHAVCFPELMLCVVAALFALVQVRTLHALTWLAGASGLAICAAMVLLLVDFAVFAPASEVDGAGFNKWNETHAWPRLDAGVVSVYGSTASFIFAFQGQSVFFEVMREMKDARQFPRAVTVATFVMMAVYVTIIVLCYLSKGSKLPPFAPDAVTNPHFRQVVGGLVAFNLFSSYLLTNVPLALALHEAIEPATSRDFTGVRGRLHWGAITSALLLFSYLVANAIPFFGAFQGLIGSALGAPILFGWPPLFFLAASRKYGAKVSTRDAVLCRLFIGVVFPVCFSLGLYSAVRSMVLQWGGHGTPFSCHPSD